MSHLTRNDYAAALALLIELEQAAGDASRLLRTTVERLAALIPCETAVLVTDQGDRPADGEARSAAGARAAEAFTASMSLTADGAMRTFVVLQRRCRAFTQRDRDRLALLQPHLCYLYAQSRRQGEATFPVTARPAALPPIRTRQLTPRENDVMRWLSCGKTDADIAALLAISPRTVHKHLEHIYEKLGVETRTAAVMAVRRAFSQHPG